MSLWKSVAWTDGEVLLIHHQVIRPRFIWITRGRDQDKEFVGDQQLVDICWFQLPEQNSRNKIWMWPKIIKK